MRHYLEVASGSTINVGTERPFRVCELIFSDPRPSGAEGNVLVFINNDETGEKGFLGYVKKDDLKRLGRAM